MSHREWTALYTLVPCVTNAWAYTQQETQGKATVALALSFGTAGSSPVCPVLDLVLTETVSPAISLSWGQGAF